VRRDKAATHSPPRATPRNFKRAPVTHCQNCQNAKPPDPSRLRDCGCGRMGGGGLRREPGAMREAGLRLRGASIGAAKKPTNLDSPVQGA